MLDHEVAAACSSEEHIAQEVAAVLVLHHRDGLFAGHHQRGHGGGTLHRRHVVQGEGSTPAHADQSAQVGTGRHDGLQPDLPLASLISPREGHRPGAGSLDPEASAGFDEVGLAESVSQVVGKRGRSLAAVRGGDQHPQVKDPTQLGRDLIEIAPLQDEESQGPVQGVDAFQDPGGDLTESGIGRLEQVVEGQSPRQTEHGEVEFVGQGKRGRINFVDVSSEFHPHPGEVAGVQVLHQPGQRHRLAAGLPATDEREAGGDQ